MDGIDNKPQGASDVACHKADKPAEATAATPLTDEQLQAVTIGERIPLNGPIHIADYDPGWPQRFQREAARIQRALGDRILLLEHVGSTSVPGLAAKPIIDILLIVTDPANETAYVPDLEAATYTLRIREPDWYEHRMFKGSAKDVNLHVFAADSPEAECMLRFRDWLRNNTADRQHYEQTKRELARKNWQYTQNYADAKSSVVTEILARIQNNDTTQK